MVEFHSPEEHELYRMDPEDDNGEPQEEMPRFKYEEPNSIGIWYEKVGDVYLPLTIMPKPPEEPLGKYGQMRLDFLMQNPLLLFEYLGEESDLLYPHLNEIDEEAWEQAGL